ncbi:MAG TPA: HEAT repeat domain-containing protein [Gammaproteobacteria bacterium]|nr:HEAT repeat domain-containing protein [Gammaproteobacteria bacterium]
MATDPRNEDDATSVPAQTCADPGPAMEPDHRDAVLQTLFAALDLDNSLSRSCAVRALEKMGVGDGAAREKLLALLRDEDADVRMDAARALGRLRFEEAVEPLLDDVENDPEGDVRIEAMRALEFLCSKRSVERLIACLRAEGYPELDLQVDDLDYGACWEVQACAMRALGAIGDPRAVDAIIETVGDDANEDMIEDGYRVLSQLDDSRARRFLLEQLRHGGVRARRRAASALAGEAADVSLPEEISGALREALADENAGVRIEAARCLANRPDPWIYDSLTPLLEDADTTVRTELVRILGGACGTWILDRLHSQLTRSRLGLQRTIVEVVGEIGDPASYPLLATLLETTDEDLLYEVVRALGLIGHVGKETVRIADLLDNNKMHTAVRAQAAEALGQLLDNVGDTEAPATDDGETVEIAAQRFTESLRAALFDDSEQVAAAALTALIEANRDSASEFLCELVRSGAALAETRDDTVDDDNTGVETDEAAISGVVSDLIADRDPQSSTLAAIVHQSPTPAAQPPEAAKTARRSIGAGLQVLAARLLGGLDNPGMRATDVLVEAAEAGPTNLRKEAMLALGYLTDGRALPTLKRGLETADQALRLAAFDALCRFPAAPGKTESLVEILDDPDPQMRQRAIEALSADGGAGAREHLPRMIRDGDQNVCRAALRALPKESSGDGSATAILDAVFAFSAELRFEAAAAMRRSKEFSSTRYLTATISDAEEEDFHWICIDALGEMYARTPGQLD